MLETIFNELFGKFLIYFFRDAVQSQYQAVALSVIISYLIARLLIFFIKQRMAALESRTDRQARILKNGWAFTEWLIFPVLALISTEIILRRFSASGALVGVIEDAIYLLFLFFIYRLVLAIAYMLFDHATIRGLNRQLFGPLFILFVLSTILNDFVRFANLGQVILLEEFDPPLTIGRIFLIIVGLYFWITVIIRLGEFLHNLVKKYSSGATGKMEGVLTLTEYLLIGLAVYAALISLGINTTTIAAITGGLSVGIGFGMREIITSFIGGIILLFEGSIEPGDILTLDNDRADVKKLGVRSTLVQRDDGTELLIPNAMLFESQVTKRTGSDSFIRTILYIRASYKDEPEKVIAVLEEACRSFPKILDEPNPPRAFIGEFGEYAIVYRLEVWTDHRIIGPIGVKKNLNPRIYKVFKENNIEMPLPQQNIQFNVDNPPPPIAAVANG